MDGVEGLEPPMTGPKPVALPLGHTPKEHHKRLGLCGRHYSLKVLICQEVFWGKRKFFFAAFVVSYPMANYRKPQPIGRIIQIVKCLYAFERLRINALAREYEVDARTIRRDMNKIADAGIPLLSKRGEYRLDTTRLSQSNRLPSELLHSFASNAGMSIECLGGEHEGIPLILSLIHI